MISCQVDDETQVITLRVRAQDPLVAATMVDSVCAHLQDFITEYHTSKARVDLDYYRKLEMDARKNICMPKRNMRTFVTRTKELSCRLISVNKKVWRTNCNWCILHIPK